MNVFSRIKLAGRRRPSLALLLPPLLASGCGGLHLEQYAEATPSLDPFLYFPGHTRAWGIVQDWRGRVVRRFDVDILGSTVDGELVLDETFRYADGETATRQWRINRDDAGVLEGRADDIIGSATGAYGGNSMRWRYSMDLEVGEASYRVNFDDWMWQLDDEVVINRSYIQKLGVTVAEVTLFMQKVVR